jgi:KDO2-lipid IV(A) lauroyltransferase
VKKRRRENPIKGIVKLGVIKFLIWLVNILPQRLLYGLARALTLIYWLVLRPFRDTALFNLNRVFGKGKSQKEIKRLAKKNAFYIVKNVCELFRGQNLTKDQIDRLFEIEGKENLDRALAKGKGVIGLSAHIGNFMLVSIKMNREGYSFGYIARDILGDRIAKLLADMRRRMGAYTISAFPPHASTHRCIDWLRKNNILFLQFDRIPIKGGIVVNFFGHPAATMPGPIVLARRTGAAIVPMFIVRQKNNTHKIVIEPEVKLEKTGDKKKDLLKNVQKLTKVIENAILKYPEDYFWLFERWMDQALRRSEKRRYGETGKVSRWE